MSNLIPERRMNKNGVWSTKYVRPVSGEARSSKALAAPPVLAAANLPTPHQTTYPWQDRKTDREIWSRSFQPSRKLLDYLSSQDSRFASRDDYIFDASDREVYEVLSVVTPDDALPLLDAGITTATEAKKVLKSAGLSRLIDDYSDMTGEALERGIRADAYLSTFGNEWELFRDDSERFLDAAQKTSDYALKREFEYPFGTKTTLQKLIDDGSIDAAHVQYIGAERVRDAMDHSGHLVTGLKQLHEGSSKFTVEHLDTWISDFGMRDHHSVAYVKGLVFLSALRHPPEYVSSLTKSNFNAISEYTYAETAVRLGIPPEEERRFIDHGIESSLAILNSGATLGSGYKDHEVGRLFYAGVTPEEIGMGIKNGMSAEQLIALKEPGNAASLSSGWL